jgi:DNA-binding CsgD family transcriptional regulator
MTRLRRFRANLHIPDGSLKQQEAFDHSLHATTTPGNAERIICTHATNSIIPFEGGRAIAALIPDARFVPLETRNHDILADEPAWQQMIEELDDFLPGRLDGGRSSAMDELTAREREVLEIIAQGVDNARIADRLKIGGKTVRNHVWLIFSKLGVNSRAEAVARARRRFRTQTCSVTHSS